nr:actin cytoskeleton-regulatory complex protein pan1-like [Lolium perenne]
MGSNSPPVDTIATTSTAATNTTPAAMTGGHALQGAAAANGDQAAAVPTGLDLLPATLADLADSLRAIRFELAEIKAGQHPPPPPAAVPPPPPPAAVPPPPTPAAARPPTARLRRRQWPARVVAAVALADSHMDRRVARLH